MTMWNGIPFVRILIPYLLGIWWAGNHKEAWQYPLITGLAALLVWLMIGRIPPWKTWAWEPIRGSMVTICICSAGALTLQGKQASMSAADIHPEAGDSIIAMVCMLEEAPVRKRNSWRTTATLERLTRQKKCLPAGRALLYFPAESGSNLPTTGSRILIRQLPEPMHGPDFPGGFDAEGYFGRQGIGYRLFLRPGQWLAVTPTGILPLAIAMENTRSGILQLLRKNIRDPKAVGLAEALLIGYRNDLDEKLSDAYTSTGVIHVIAISGLHIGVIYALLGGLLKTILRNSHQGWLTTIICLSGIWAFGLLAGGGPSVMRSVTMFSIIGIGRQLTGREGNGLNTLAVTAAMMLAVQPWWLWDLGFQLSFTAVASLMLFNDPVREWMTLTNPIALKLWEMIAVTLSAQVLTTPILLYVFGRFPVFFLITNLVAIPLSTIILLAEIGLCLAAPLHNGLAGMMGRICEELIHGLNAYILRMDSIPFGSIEQISLSAGQMLLSYGCIACLTAWGIHRHSIFLKTMLSLLTISCVIQMWENHQREKQRQIVVMPLTGARLIMMAEGRQCVWLVTPMEKHDQRSVAVAMRAVEHHLGIRKTRTDTISHLGTIRIEWLAFKMLLLGPGSPRLPDEKPGETDLMLLSGSTRADPGEWAQNVSIGTCVADGTNKLWKIQQWESKTERLPLRLHSTRRSGAFIYRMQ
jgi:competence protein ComEC